jgi:protein phosphatase-4 regulatory subunit 3
MKSVIMLNETTLLEELLREELVMDCVGALEYDPDCGAEPQKHREFLRDQVVFKEVVPIKDALVLSKVGGGGQEKG